MKPEREKKNAEGRLIARAATGKKLQTNRDWSHSRAGAGFRAGSREIIPTANGANNAQIQTRKTEGELRRTIASAFVR